MESNKADLIAVYPKDLMSRFKSKSDIYSYMTEQGKEPLIIIKAIVGVYLPEFRRTKIEFLKAILRNEKFALK